MPLPTDAIVPSGGEPSFGIILKLHIGDRDFQTEIQVAGAATSDATVPKTSTATRLAIKAPGVSRHTHFLPEDGIARHYRARHILPGYPNGAFTDFVCRKTVRLGGKCRTHAGLGSWFPSPTRRHRGYN